MTVFVRSERFGSLTFSEEAKSALMLSALKENSVRDLRQAVPFQLLSGDAELLSAVALYQVDGRERPPKLKAGYEFEFAYRDVQKVRLRNELTGLEGVISLGTDTP
ncbi:MAG: hypothetical protein KC422_17775 [Trueperaceae bacterium]|nr:hypothetical protein [Trueperaceae bacterium]